MHKYARSERGVALLTILVMVALATILAAGIAQQQANTAENTAYLMRQNQSLMYAKSAEAFFAELLKDDAENAGQVDHLQENWAKPMPAFPVEDGFVSGTLEDQSGKFNLNSLINNEGAVNENAKKWFEKILVRAGLPAQLSEAVIDWQDEDDETAGSMGAESSYYRGLQNSAVPPNTKFHDVDELKAVRGFENGKDKLIAPYVSALNSRDAKVNINTASPFLLASIDESLDINSVKQALEQKQAKLEYFESVNDLWALSPFSEAAAEKRDAVNDFLGVQSAQFKAKIHVELGGRKRQFSSEMVRKEKTVYVAYRSMKPF
ncbi:type II secretion system minor pseudopilin GspK [Acinetobacter tianfuensis]|uniref:Type II secretion system protein K n=1 Tax=Acinetobacter tianfuensis TaxID=2419603 RepID=A0A3A8EX60_9GAMM|nr:type II secretion system minor pseudopilin GspK [Acinetobacter tianfuensis]RKG33043.1 general secretion pathway protein GspK [Acinetobacter tianfuensis]